MIVSLRMTQNHPKWRGRFRLENKNVKQQYVSDIKSHNDPESCGGRQYRPTWQGRCPLENEFVKQQYISDIKILLAPTSSNMAGQMYPRK